MHGCPPFLLCRSADGSAVVAGRDNVCFQVVADGHAGTVVLCCLAIPVSKFHLDELSEFVLMCRNPREEFVAWLPNIAGIVFASAEALAWLGLWSPGDLREDTSTNKYVVFFFRSGYSCECSR